jgi:chemotaxis protein MotB
VNDTSRQEEEMRSRIAGSAARGACLLATLTVCLACEHSRANYEARGRRIQELEGQLAECTQNYQQAQEQIESLTAENAAMSERLTALGEDVTNLRSRAGQLSADLEAARARAEELARRERQQQERLAAFRTMLCRFRAMIESRQLRVRIVRGRMVIELPSNILFSSGSADLSEEGEAALNQVAAVLREIPNRDFQVAGHTDNEPIRRSRFTSNWELSTVRALEVVEYLQEQGVTPTHLSAAGYSEFAPVAQNDSEEGRTENRRIEIVLMPNYDELPDLSGLEGASCGEAAQ